MKYVTVRLRAGAGAGERGPGGHWQRAAPRLQRAAPSPPLPANVSRLAGPSLTCAAPIDCLRILLGYRYRLVGLDVAVDAADEDGTSRVPERATHQAES